MNSNLRAGAIMLFAMVMLSFNDAVIKYAGERLGVGQMLMFRGLMVMAIFAVAIRVAGLSLWSRQMIERWSLARGALEIGATLTFLSGLVRLPLAVAATLVFTSPLFITLLAGPLLGERVGWRRWLAVLLGFVGAVLITRPWSADWSWAMLLPLIAAVFVAGRDICTRYISNSQSSLYVAFMTAALVTLGGIGYAPFDWRPVEPAALAWIGLCAMLLAAAYFALITAFRSGELSFIAPLKYSSLVIAIGLGAWIWDERLRPVQFAGVALVALSGLVIFYRERSRHAS